MTTWTLTFVALSFACLAIGGVVVLIAGKRHGKERP